MKKNKSLIWNLLLAAAVLTAVPVMAQDDLYYDPVTDGANTPVYDDDDRDESKITKQYRDDDEYYEDEYAYEYSSRIRRFHRPVQVIDYYDPFFVDMWFYDPFYMPGVSIYLGGYNDYWQWRRWNRWHRWNTWSYYDPYWGGGFNTWGWGWQRPWGWNSWYNPYVWSNYYYDPYWTWNGYNPYCSNYGWVNNNYYWDNTGGGYTGGYNPKTYTGVRRGGTTINPGYARLVNNNTTQSNRLAPSSKAPVITMQGRSASGRTEIEGPKTKTRESGDRPGVSENRPTTPRGRTTEPETTRRPAREVTPKREPRTNRETTTPGRTKREVTPKREESRTRRETAPEQEPRKNRESTAPRRENNRSNQEAAPKREPRSNNRDYDRGSNDRPSRRAEPSNERHSRFGSDNSSDRDTYRQPSSHSNDSGRASDSGTRSSDGGSRSSSGTTEPSSRSGGRRDK